jgi:hypothetical protein
MPFADVAARHYPGAAEAAEVGRWSREVLAPHGFTVDNALPLVGVCRDELLFPVEQAIHDEWGPAFDLSSLAGLLFLGRSGLAAAAQHAPGLDGRRRFVGFVMSHIGITADGSIGMVQRPGQDEPSAACGALVAYLDELTAGQVVDRPLDRDDLEMGLLRTMLTEHAAGPVRDLVALTELARTVATDELVRLSDDLLRAPDTDLAVISAVVVHGPDGDLVAVRDAWVRRGADPAAIPLTSTSGPVRS